MAAETASRQRGRGFAERLAPLRQDTPVEIKLRGLRCRPFDRSPLARQQRPPAIKRVDRARPGADQSLHKTQCDSPAHNTTASSRKQRRTALIWRRRGRWARAPCLACALRSSSPASGSADRHGASCPTVDSRRCALSPQAARWASAGSAAGQPRRGPRTDRREQAHRIRSRDRQVCLGPWSLDR